MAKTKNEHVAKGVELLNKHDIDYLAAFVLGFPGETDKTIRENIDFINDNGARYYSLKEFYYMENTKVHEKRDAYGLTGMGNKWSHATMSAQEASQIKLDMFLEIDSSTNIDPDTSLWYLTYLYDQNFCFPADQADAGRDQRSDQNSATLDPDAARCS